MERAPPWLWPNQGLRHRGFAGISRQTYFAFVEDVVGLSGLEAAEGPDGKKLTDLAWQVGEDPLRFRFAVVETCDFGEIVARIDVLDPENVTNDDRKQRRRQLQDTVADLPIPLMDVYAARDSEAARWLRVALRPGSWHYAVVLWNEYVEGFQPVVMGDPELGTEFSRRGTLAYLANVFPNILLRLQDIFSLVHIPDADFETRGGSGDKNPTPDLGGDGRGEAVIFAETLDKPSVEGEKEEPRFLEGGA